MHQSTEKCDNCRRACFLTSFIDRASEVPVMPISTFSKHLTKRMLLKRLRTERRFMKRLLIETARLKIVGGSPNGSRQNAKQNENKLLRSPPDKTQKHTKKQQLQNTNPHTQTTSSIATSAPGSTSTNYPATSPSPPKML